MSSIRDINAYKTSYAIDENKVRIFIFKLVSLFQLCFQPNSGKGTDHISGKSEEPKIESEYLRNNHIISADKIYLFSR